MNPAIRKGAPARDAVPDKDWWRGAVIYQIYPRSYQDSNGDGIGDLTGIRQRLGHIAELGADAIWISPFFASPMKDFGYDVSDYTAVDPMFGSIEDFQALVEDAHALGLKVMIDQVLSHTSDRHPWFIESRSSRHNARSDWYVWADPKPDGTPPNNWLAIFGGSAWQWDTTRCQYYLHNFLDSQPDLNFHNRDVQDALLDTVRFWLDLGVDGFRLDTINFYFHSQGLEDNPALPPEERDDSTAPSVNPYNFQNHVHDKSQPENIAFLERFRALLDEYPAATAVGEVGDAQRGQELMAAYTAGERRVHMCYSFEFLSSTLPSPAHIGAVVTDFFDAAPDGWPCWAFSNHDVERHASRWTSDLPEPMRLARQKLLAGVLLTLRGSACLYQGEELGLPEADLSFEDLQDPYGIRFWPKFKGRDGCRTPMVWTAQGANGGFSTAARPWLPVPADHLPLAVSEQAGRPDSLLEFYRHLLAFRRDHPALAKGGFTVLDLGPELLAFRRDLDAESLLCVFNFATARTAVDLPGSMTARSLDGHGFGGTLHANTLTIDGLDGWVGRLDA
ncbi:alpha-glucosidase [Zhengella mangrovi]|uniref:Alpha-glucosidase n=1 Tax=Zhengella mangrovi TaxID=1982044 RepID=A0A2G1QQK9_9HYPH|nr:alpha-amylase family glycosyl hydrolase [Zhengella mangrovi]PHP67816.1 alpha-glucosidase [Zhengella mangrovi]